MFSLDGRYLISGNKKSTVLVWDLASGKVDRRFGAVRGNILDLEKISAKKYLLVGEPFKLRIGASYGIWQFIKIFFSLVTGGTDHNLWVFDLDSGEMIRNFTGHKSGVFLARFSPDGRYIASLEKSFMQGEGALKTWSLETGEGLPVAEGITGMKDLAIFPDSKRLAMTDGYATIIMDLETGKILKRFQAGGYHLGLMDKGQLLVCLKKEQLVFLNPATGEVTSDINFEKEFKKMGDNSKLSEYFTTMAISPQGDTLLAATNHGKLIVFGLKDS